MRKIINIVAVFYIFTAIFLSGGMIQSAQAAVSCAAGSNYDNYGSTGQNAVFDNLSEAQCRSTCSSWLPSNSQGLWFYWLATDPPLCHCGQNSYLIGPGGSSRGGYCPASYTGDQPNPPPAQTSYQTTYQTTYQTSYQTTYQTTYESTYETTYESSYGLDNPIATESFNVLISNIYLWFYIFSVPILSLMLLYGAFLIITSRGEEEKYNQGKKIVKWGILGFILVMLSGAIAAIIRSVVG